MVHFAAGASAVSIASLFSSAKAARVERNGSDRVERVRLPLEAIADADASMLELLAHWRALRSDGLLPSKSLVDPVALRRFLGRIHIVDTTAASAEDYFFRLWGSSVSLDQGRNYGKLRIGDYPHEAWRRGVMQDYADVVTTGVPAYHLVSATLDFLPYQYARLILPLADDGRTVSHLLVHIHERPIAADEKRAQAVPA